MNNGTHEELLRASVAPQQPMTTTSTILRFVAEASADSPGGRVAAGTVMKWIDEAAAVVAHQWAKSPCVAASFGKIRFAHPVVAGALVEVEARLAYTGTTSMNIFIEVRSGPQISEAYQEVTHCVAVFVSPDEHGTPRPVDTWTPRPQDQAKAQGVKVKKGLFPWAASGRAIANGRDEGFTKLLFDDSPEAGSGDGHAGRGHGKILGGGMVGTHAGDMIGEIALGIEMGADAVDIGKTIHPHPTLGESIGMAAEVAHGSCTDVPPARK